MGIIFSSDYLGDNVSIIYDEEGKKPISIHLVDLNSKLTITQEDKPFTKTRVEECKDLPSALRRMADIIEAYQKKGS